MLFTEEGDVDLILGGREPLQLGWGKRFSYQEVAGGWCGELGTALGRVYSWPPGHKGPLWSS